MDGFVMGGISAMWSFNLRDIKTGEIIRIGPVHNKITDGGLFNLAALLVGDVPSDTAATHIVLGTNGAAATEEDTLATMAESARGPITIKSWSLEVARMRTFFGPSAANGTHACFGVVARGTDSAGSGVLLNRIVQSFTKTSSQVLTVDVRWFFRNYS